VRLRPELNWPYAIFVGLMFFLMFGFIAYQATFAPFAGGSPAAILLTRIGMVAFSLFAMLFLLNQLRNDSQLEIDDDGISKPTLFGMRVLRWTEIREVRFGGYEVRLLSADTRIVIHPYVYADPYAFMPEIGSRLRHLLPEQPTVSEQRSSSASQDTREGRLRRLLKTVAQPRNLASAGHLAAICFYLLVLRSNQLGLGRYWFVAGVWFGIGMQYASQQLWKRVTAPIPAVVELTWAAIVAAVVLTSATTWDARQSSAVAFCVVLVTLLTLRLLFVWIHMILSAAVEARRASGIKNSES
jgi:hypothetical protein